MELVVDIVRPVMPGGTRSDTAKVGTTGSGLKSPSVVSGPSFVIYHLTNLVALLEAERGELLDVQSR
jgi:hypothetical protein